MRPIRSFRGYVSINESLSSQIFHFTTLPQLASMLRGNTMAMSVAFGTGADKNINLNRPYFLSLSTTGHGEVGFARSISKYSGKVTVVFDGKALNNLGKGGPVDYWAISKSPSKTEYENILRYDEHEERLYMDKPEIKSISRYIKSIHVYIGELESSHFDLLHEAWALCTKLNIEFYPYENETHYNHRVSKFADITNFDNDTYQSYLDSGGRPVVDKYIRSLEGPITLMCLLDDARKAKIRTYLMSSREFSEFYEKYNIDPKGVIDSIIGRDDKLIERYLVKIAYGYAVALHDYSTGVKNEVHNANSYTRFKTVRDILDMFWKEIKPHGGDITKYILHKVSQYVEARGPISGLKTDVDYIRSLANGTKPDTDYFRLAGEISAVGGFTKNPDGSITIDKRDSEYIFTIDKDFKLIRMYGTYGKGLTYLSQVIKVVPA